jgi:Bacterial regulatory protein, arsR family.
MRTEGEEGPITTGTASEGEAVGPLYFPPLGGNGMEEDEGELLALLDDEYARAILAELTIEPMSVSELCTACEMSDPTAYRRLDRLQAADLVTDQQALDPDGHHHKRYVATLEDVTVTFADGTYDVTVTRSSANPADRFTDLFEGLS